jgi:hypothetical protein
MNCPQCQAVNGSDAAFCGNCGARLDPAAAAGQASSPGTPLGYSAPGNPAAYGAPTVQTPAAGYGPPPGNSGPSGYGPPPGNSGPSGYGAPPGNSGPSGYGGPAGYGAPAGGDAPPGYGPPAPGYGPPGGQPPAGYPQGQYQPGQAGPYVQRSSGLPPVKFDLNRLTTVDKIVAGATLVTMISLWLPWYSGKYSALGETSTGTISGTADHGWLWLEFILALVLLAYLVARAAWDRLPFNLPVAHAPLLIVGTGLQFLLVLIGFIALPSTNNLPGLSISWDFGAFLALLASIVAAGPVIYPAVRSYLDSRNAAGGAHKY